jgi:hypothetical protein
MAGSFPLDVLSAVALAWRRGTLRAAVVAAPVVAPAVPVVVRVAGALPVSGEPLERGADLLPVAPPTRLTPVGFGAEQLSRGRGASVPGRLRPSSALGRGTAPARRWPPRLPVVGALVTDRPGVDGGPLRAWPGAPEDSGR